MADELKRISLVPRSLVTISADADEETRLARGTVETKRNGRFPDPIPEVPTRTRLGVEIRRFQYIDRTESTSATMVLVHSATSACVAGGAEPKCRRSRSAES